MPEQGPDLLDLIITVLQTVAIAALACGVSLGLGSAKGDGPQVPPRVRGRPHVLRR